MPPLSSRTAEHMSWRKQAMAYFDAGSIPSRRSVRRHVEERWFYRTRRGRAYQGNIKPVAVLFYPRQEHPVAFAVGENMPPATALKYWRTRTVLNLGNRVPNARHREPYNWVM
jgi:hypothetical protein